MLGIGILRNCTDGMLEKACDENLKEFLGVEAL
jgi:hypothetical protein